MLCRPERARENRRTGSLDALVGQLLGSRWSEIDVRPAAVGFSRAYVDSPTGPVLRATKTHRAYRVAIDQATMRRLVEHRRRGEQRAADNEVVLTSNGFVFSSKPDDSKPLLAPRRHETTALGGALETVDDQQREGYSAEPRTTPHAGQISPSR